MNVQIRKEIKIQIKIKGGLFIINRQDDYINQLEKEILMLKKRIKLLEEDNKKYQEEIKYLEIENELLQKDIDRKYRRNEWK